MGGVQFGRFRGRVRGELGEVHTRVDRQAGPLAKDPPGRPDGPHWEHGVRELFKQE